MSTRQRIRPALLCSLFALCGCTRLQLAGTSSAYVVIEQLTAAPGARPAEFSGTLPSDVLTYVKKQVEGRDVCVPTVFPDQAQVSFHLALQDPGSPEAPTAPTSANTITLTRYHVAFLRADGRRAPGLDVPYAFDGAMTAAVSGPDATKTQITLVRAQAKQESPLEALTGGGGARVISTIAEVTFYGTDAAGRAVRAVGYVNVDFSDWSDPEC